MYNESIPNNYEDRGGRRVAAVDERLIHIKYLEEVLNSEILAKLYEYPADA